MKATLTYHSLDDSGSVISLPPKVFAAHVTWLTSGRVQALTLDQLAAQDDAAGDAVSVTFDDGFLNIRGAVERLLGHGIPVTIFAVSRCVGGTNTWGGRPQRHIPTLPLLGWDDLESLIRLGAAVETHTRSHAVLTRVAGSALDDELLGSQDDFQARLGTRPTHLAYPYGEVDDVVAARAARYFRLGHTTDFRFATSAEAPMWMPRLDMYYYQSPGSLEAWGTPAFVRRVAWCGLRRKIRARLIGSPAPAAAEERQP